MFSSNATQVSAVTQAEAVDFDGTNDYLSRASNLTGNTDGKTLTFSGWIWANSATAQTFYAAGTGSELIIFCDVSGGALNFRVLTSDTTLTTNLSVTSSAGLIPLQTWTHILLSVDLNNSANRSIYVNDVLISPTWTIYTNSTIDRTFTTYNVANNPSSSTRAKGRLSNVYLDYTYRDLSITANRRLFVTADLKPAAGQAALNPILYLPMSDPTTVGTNAGTGGNFTLTGTVARSGRGPNQYNAPYSDLDGAADSLSRASDPTGLVDGNAFTLSFNVNFDTVSAPQAIVSVAGGYFVIQLTSSNVLSIVGYTSALAGVISATVSSAFVIGRNYQVVMSFDMSSTSKRQIYINGQSSTVTYSTYNNANIDWTRNSFRIGGPDYVNGRLGAVWFNTSYIDLSVPSNLAKFVTGTGIDAKPVDLGASGELPTGTSPLIYLPMYGNNAGKNYGTGGDFTVNSGPYTGARGPNEFWSGAGLFNNPTQTELSALTLNNSPDVTGITKTTFAVCFKRRDVDVTDNSVIFNTTSSTNNNFHFSVYFNSSEQLVIGWNGHSVATSSTITDTNWHTLLVSVDSTATVARVYLDNVSLTSTITLNRTYTQAYTYVGRATGVSADQCFDGNIGFVYQAHDYIDISQEANRLKFFDAFGYPVDLSAQVTAGAIPAPYIYLLFPESNLGTNNGTAGNFTNNSVTASALVKA